MSIDNSFKIHLNWFIQKELGDNFSYNTKVQRQYLIKTSNQKKNFFFNGIKTSFSDKKRRLQTNQFLYFLDKQALK